MGAIVYIRYLNSESAEVEWMIKNAAGVMMHPPTISAIETIKTDMTYQSVICFVPGQNVSVTTVILPASSKNRLMQSLPFALEEQVAQDIETLHFAMSDTADKSQKSVAIASREFMAKWLTPLQSAGYPCQMMLPDFLALPYQDTAWSVAILPHVILVRSGLLSGFCTDTENFLLYLQSALAQQQSSPLQINLYCFSDFIISEKLNLLGITINIIEHDFALIDLLSCHYQSARTLNLLQGSYQPKQTRHLYPLKWKGAGILAAAALSLFFIKSGYEYFLLQHELSLYHQQIESVYKEIFPQATRVVAPQERVDAALRQLESSQSGGQFLGLMAKVGIILKSMPQITIKDFTFQNNQIIFNVQTDSFESLEKIIQPLTRTGINVSQENAVSLDNIISARLIIRG